MLQACSGFVIKIGCIGRKGLLAAAVYVGRTVHVKGFNLAFTVWSCSTSFLSWGIIRAYMAWICECVKVTLSARKAKKQGLD